MADIFGSNAALVPIANDNKVRLTIQGLTTNDQIFITDTNGSMSPNYQIQYSVGAQRFINSFSHRLSTFTLGGKYVLADCNGPLDSITNPAFFEFYKNRNISNSADPIRIAYAGLVITGYLTGLELGTLNQEAIDGFPFTLRFLGDVDGLTQRESSTQVEGAPAGYDEIFTYQPGKTGPNRSAEATVNNAAALGSTPIGRALIALTDRQLRNAQRFSNVSTSAETFALPLN